MLKMANIFILIIIFNFKAFSRDEIEINADQFTYDKNNTRIYATGNVEIIDNLFKLQADKFLNNDTNVISASENVTVFNKVDGTLLRAEK